MSDNGKMLTSTQRLPTALADIIYEYIRPSFDGILSQFHKYVTTCGRKELKRNTARELKLRLWDGDDIVMLFEMTNIKYCRRIQGGRRVDKFNIRIEYPHPTHIANIAENFFDDEESAELRRIARWLNGRIWSQTVDARQAEIEEVRGQTFLAKVMNVVNTSGPYLPTSTVEFYQTATLSSKAKKDRSKFCDVAGTTPAWRAYVWPSIKKLIVDYRF